MWKEVEYFKDYQKRLRRYAGRSKSEEIVNEAVYIISIGTNDFLENYFLLITGRFKQFSVDGFVDFLIGLAGDFLTEIYRLGARKMAFAGLAPIGCLPLERTANILHGHGCIRSTTRWPGISMPSFRPSLNSCVLLCLGSGSGTVQCTIKQWTLFRTHHLMVSLDPSVSFIVMFR